MVQQLASGAAHEPLRDRIHVRRPYRDLDHPGACAFRNVVETQAELVVAVAKQDRRWVAGHEGVPQLLRRPCLGGVSRRNEMDDTP